MRGDEGERVREKEMSREEEEMEGCSRWLAGFARPTHRISSIHEAVVLWIVGAN